MRSAEPEVRAAAGMVRGREEDGVAVFRGIPFAQAPVGGLRFAAPRPVRHWEGVREAAAFGPPPPQSAAMGGRGAPSPEVTDTDWLTVNVWSPGSVPDRLPVMVWVYGGAYMTGQGGDATYDGAVLARHGVVVVTFNYRVGMEGFAQIEGAPANRGLLDQVAALTWVRDNIAAFGGDPGRVTVFGESAGAGCVASLLAMPRAAGLFQRAIAQSVPGTFFSAELAADIAGAAAAELGLRATVADLAGVEPGRLVGAGDAVSAKMAQHDRWGAVAHTPMPFSPVVDGEVLPQAPWQALAAGSARNVELIVGHNRDEYRLFLALSGQSGQITDEQAATALRAFAPGADGPGTYRAAYPGAGASELYERVQTDWLFAAPSQRLAQAHVQGGGRAHLYELTWSSPAMDGALGSCHVLDVPLVFGNFSAGMALLLMGDTPPPEAAALSGRMRTAWTSFAADGDPGWPAYDNEHRLTRIWDAEPSVRAYPEEAARLIWRDHEFSALPLLA
ncbi:carboxylesterase/lipase family protein [Actinacidiphila oryziradicis]|uniref:Carboxylic ester hydrolase n=1 Tax=Actinacidiphila oryziradicis TaxID=2571141 RepID=A0A4U0RWL8_9ACTN|nr:carboxylesterase family protein [Actinacidiphila oryziradicis]TKA00640.1 carboxylesterase family protein [Actinacidiphila oryziradicis]